MELILLDVEQTKAGRIFLIGSAGAQFTQVCTDPSLAGAAQASGLICEGPDERLAKLLDLSQRTGWPIAAYTRHEWQVFQNVLGVSPPSYLDLHKVARGWLNRSRKGAWARLGEQKTLVSVSREILGSGPPRDHASGHTVARFETVSKALARREGRYEALTPVQKAKWTKALKHNRWDVEILRQLVTVMQDSDPEAYSAATRKALIA